MACSAESSGQVSKHCSVSARQEISLQSEAKDGGEALIGWTEMEAGQWLSCVILCVNVCSVVFTVTELNCWCLLGIMFTMLSVLV